MQNFTRMHVTVESRSQILCTLQHIEKNSFKVCSYRAVAVGGALTPQIARRPCWSTGSSTCIKDGELLWVIGCGKRANRDKGTSYYRLPSIITYQGAQTRELSERRRREWLAAIQRQDIRPENYPHTRVCSDHFIGGKPSTLYETTHPDWVPSRNRGHDERKEVEGGRYARAAERTAKRTANRTRM